MDALGNKTNEPANVPAVGSAPDLSHTLSYGYDSRDELTGEMSAQAGSGSGGTSVYTNLFGYDLSLNPTTFKGSTVTENADNQFTLSGFVYDGNGSPTTYSSQSLTFDTENRLTAITSPAFAATYAPDDRRASKTAAGVTTYYLYDEAGGASPLAGRNLQRQHGQRQHGLRHGGGRTAGAVCAIERGVVLPVFVGPARLPGSASDRRCRRQHLLLCFGTRPSTMGTGPS